VAVVVLVALLTFRSMVLRCVYAAWAIANALAWLGRSDCCTNARVVVQNEAPRWHLFQSGAGSLHVNHMSTHLMTARLSVGLGLKAAAMAVLALSQLWRYLQPTLRLYE